MQLNTAQYIWDKIIQIYEGDIKIKRDKLQMFIIQYETLIMHNNEIIAIFVFRLDYIVNSMRNLDNEVHNLMVVEKILRFITQKFDSKVFSIEEM